MRPIEPVPRRGRFRNVDLDNAHQMIGSTIPRQNRLLRMLGFRRIRVIDSARFLGADLDGGAMYQIEAQHFEWRWLRWRLGSR